MTYKGKEYKTRRFIVKDIILPWTAVITVSLRSLQEALGEYPYKDNSEEEIIDDEIAFYLDDELIDLPAAEIVTKYLYEEFTLIEEL